MIGNSNHISNSNVIPWVEKYRPEEFNKIILDDVNKRILGNILKHNHFPNLILYGPPGTGKTTTIVNLIRQYQLNNNQCSKELIIHLNASDERGVDVIRNQIHQFVSSNNLFHSGMKFVILDEVDYMTKSAQQALKCLLQSQPNNVRYCLMCNYVSRIEHNLQLGFVKLRFDQLPVPQIFSTLRQICDLEKITLSDDSIYHIQKLFGSDMRSMINFIQINKDVKKIICVLHDEIWEEIYTKITNNNLPIHELNKQIALMFYNITAKYEEDTLNCVRNFLSFIVKNKPEQLTIKFMDMVNVVINDTDSSIDELIQFMIMYIG